MVQNDSTVSNPPGCWSPSFSKVSRLSKLSKPHLTLEDGLLGLVKICLFHFISPVYVYYIQLVCLFSLFGLWTSQMNRNPLQRNVGARKALLAPMYNNSAYEGAPWVLRVRGEMKLQTPGTPRDWRKPVSALGGEKCGYSQQALYKAGYQASAPLREKRFQFEVAAENFLVQVFDGSR